MKRLVFFGIPFLVTVVFLLFAFYLPLPVAVNSDFRVLYYTDKALIEGVDIYNHAAKTELVAREEGVIVEQISAFPQFAYPPWLSLLTFYMGYFSIQSAATLWFEINLTMLVLSVWFLTDGWSVKKRLLSFLFVFAFIPVFGTLIIGQYDFPILLGASLLNYSIKKEKPLLSALGFFLLTFKPHLGGLLILACLLHLISRRDKYGKQSLIWIAIFALVAFVVGFIADSAWFLNYLDSLLGYRELSHITTCSECANLSVWLAQWITGDLSLSVAGKIAAVILLILLTLIILIRTSFWKYPALLINSIIFITLIASPYLYNYDYLLLLFPIFWLAGERLNTIEWGTLFLTILIPAFALGLLGRDGNIAFLAITLVIALMVIKQARLNLD